MAQAVEAEVGARPRVVGSEALLTIADLIATGVGGGVAIAGIVAAVAIAGPVAVIAVGLRGPYYRSADDRARRKAKARAAKSATTIIAAPIPAAPTAAVLHG